MARYTAGFYVPPYVPQIGPIKSFGYRRSRPCPGCGSKNIQVDKEKKFYYCADCKTKSPPGETIAAAKTNWNNLPRRRGCIS